MNRRNFFAACAGAATSIYGGWCGGAPAAVRRERFISGDWGPPIVWVCARAFPVNPNLSARGVRSYKAFIAGLTMQRRKEFWAETWTQFHKAEEPHAPNG